MLTRKPIKRTPLRPYRPKAKSAAFRVRLAKRSGGECEARLPGCLRVATDVCHRIAAKMGGRPTDGGLRLSNVWHGCRACHGWTHLRPVEAGELGLMLKEGQDTLVEPMAYLNAGFVRLDDDGGLWPVGS